MGVTFVRCYAKSLALVVTVVLFCLVSSGVALAENSAAVTDATQTIAAADQATDLTTDDSASSDDQTLVEILIIELQVASSDSASEEYIELYNTTSAPIELADWELQYKSATGTEWRNKASLDGVIEPRGRYLVASKDYLVDIADDTSNASSLGLAGAAGNVRLVQIVDQEINGVEQATDVVIDQISWGSPDLDDNGQLVDDAEDVTLAPDTGLSTKRLVDEDGYFIDSDSSHADWFVSQLPTPASDDAPPDTDADSDGGAGDSNDDSMADGQDNDDTTNSGTDDDAEEDDSITLVTSVGGGSTGGDNPGPSSYPEVIITELFPDPVSPQRDSDDEFIELHNPNNFAVNLLDWQLQSGNTYRYKFTFPRFTLAPGQYAAFSIKDTGATLSNSGSRARLLDPSGDVAYETAEYADAEGGQTFALSASGSWVWTTVPSPGRANIIAAAAEVGSESDGSGSSSSSASSSSDSLSAGSERSISGLVTSDTSSTEGRDIFEDPAAIDSDQLNQRLIVALLVFSAGYAAYQYRTDIVNLYHRQLKYRLKK